MDNLLKNVEWPDGYVHYAKKDQDTYLLEFGGIDVDTFESFSGYVYINKCKEACNVGKWVAVPQNPFVEYYDTVVIMGGSPVVVRKKVLKQISKWKKNSMEAKGGKEQEQHKVQEQYTGETDSLPF